MALGIPKPKMIPPTELYSSHAVIPCFVHRRLLQVDQHNSVRLCDHMLQFYFAEAACARHPMAPEAAELVSKLLAIADVLENSVSSFVQPSLVFEGTSNARKIRFFDALHSIRAGAPICWSTICKMIVFTASVSQLAVVNKCRAQILEFIFWCNTYFLKNGLEQWIADRGSWLSMPPVDVMMASLDQTVTVANNFAKKTSFD